MKSNAKTLASLVTRRVGDRDAMEGVLREVAENYLNYRMVAARELEQLSELTVPSELLVTVPALQRDVCSLADVLEVGRHLW